MKKYNGQESVIRKENQMKKKKKLLLIVNHKVEDRELSLVALYEVDTEIAGKIYKLRKSLTWHQQ